MELDRLFDLATVTRVPVLLWGPPGVGKSAAVQSWAAKRGLPCWTVIASLREPSDFGGLPVVDGHGADGSLPSVHFVPPRFAVEASQRGGLIFLDELTTAPPAVQAALLRAVVDRAFGDLELDPGKVALVAAGNPPEIAAGGWNLAAPLSNRFLHHQYELSAPQWIDSFPAYWGAPPALEFGGRQLSEERWRLARTQVAAFLRSRPHLLLQVPGEVARQGQAWPSPRSWDFASRAVAAVGNARKADDIVLLVAGCVGEGAALEFATWLRDLDLPNPEDLLTKPAEYRHPQRSDQAYAILNAVALSAIARLTQERWEAAWQIHAAAAGSGGADVAAASARKLALARKPELRLPVEHLEAFFPVLEAAGLLAPSAEVTNGR
ncbi:MAG: AAA family ATPase [Dehalococcoidia bacterium]|nr:AAA family ATPase [Dehalococcoidia bacterium]